MSSKFTHYLITRFNVPVKNWERDKEGNPILDASWMKDRINLFTTYCVPTIEGQTSKAFQWLIYCDSNSVPEFLLAIAFYIKNVPNAEIRAVDDYQHMLSDLKKTLADVSTPYVITSRVDNDDGLGETYIQKTQDFFTEGDKILLNLTGGILYDRDKHILTELQNMRLNHYGSLIEKTSKEGNYLTVLGYPHHQPPDNVQVQNIPCRYAWLKIIHSRNLNSRTFGVPVFLNKITDQYHIDKDAFQVSKLNSVMYLMNRSLTVLKHKIFPKSVSRKW